MKKNFLFSALTLLIMAVSVTLVSCGDDGDDGPETTTSLTSVLTGSWVTSTAMHSDGTHDGIIFNAGGNGIYAEHYDRSTGADIQDFTYTVNESAKTITMVFNGESEVATVVSYSASAMRLNWDGNIVDLTKQNFSYDDDDDNVPVSGLTLNQLVGTWQVTESTNTWTDSEGEHSSTGTEANVGARYVVESNGTSGKVTLYETGNGGESYYEGDSFLFVINADGTITVLSNDFITSLKVISVSATNLEIETGWQDGEDGVIYSTGTSHDKCVKIA